MVQLLDTISKEKMRHHFDDNLADKWDFCGQKKRKKKIMIPCFIPWH